MTRIVVGWELRGCELVPVYGPTMDELWLALAAGTRSAETTGSVPKGCPSGDAKQRNAQSKPPSGGSSHA